ncbi:MAG: hypothetical protein RL653_116 [Pseudomonadota bacterium]
MRAFVQTLRDPRVHLSLLQSFLLGLPRVFTVTAASTLFFVHASAEMLPLAYALSAGLVATVGYAYGRVEKSFGLRVAGMAALLFLCLALCMSRLLLLVPAVAVPLAYAFILLGEAEANLTNITFWSVANRLFSVREAGRLFGFVSTGEVIASIVGGLVVAPLNAKVGPEGLLLVSAFLHGASLWTLDIVAGLAPGLFGAAPAAREESAPAAPAGGLWQLLKQRYLQLAGALLCLNVLVFFFVDNAFYHAAQAQFGGPEALPRVLGLFFTALGTGNLLFKLFVSGRWRAWFGLRDALLSTPASLAALAATALLLFVVAGPEYATIAVLGLKVMERLFVEGVNSPTYYSLFQPLPVDVRSRAQNALETQVAQVAAAVGGGVLLLLTKGLGFGAAGITAATLVLLLAWVVAAWLIGNEYVQVLGRAVSQGRLASRAVRIDAQTVQLLLQLLDSPHPPRVIYSLQLLEKQPSAEVDAAILALLRHPDETVVQAACRALVSRRTPGADAALFTCLDPPPGEGEDVRCRAHWLQTLARLSPAAAEPVLTRHLNGTDPSLRAAALVALALHGGATARDQASLVLEVLCSSEQPEQRVAAAWAIARLDDVPSVNRLLLLMQDRAPAVRLEALRAAGRRNNPILFPSMLLYLQRGEFRAECTAALVHLGPAVVHQLLGHFRAARMDQRELYLPVMGRIGGAAVEKTLVRELQESPRDLRLDMLRALEGTGHAPTPAELPLYRALFEEELGAYAELLACRRDVEGLAAPLLHAALDSELAKSARRAVLLFGFVHHGRLKALGIRLRRSDLEDAPLGLELLENLLGPDEAARVLPIFEPLSVEERLKRLRPGEAPPEPDPRRALQLLCGGTGAYARWLASCAAVAAEECGVGVDAPPLPAEARERFEWVRLLAAVRFLSAVSGERLASLSTRCHLRAAAPGLALVPPGAHTSSLWLLREGALEVMAGNAPAESVHGGLAILAPGPSLHGLRAARPSIVLELTHDDLFELFARDFDVAWGVLCRLCEWLRERDGGGGAPAAAAARALGTRGSHRLRSGMAVEEPEESTHVERLLGLKCSRLFNSLAMEVLADIAERVTERFLEEGECLVAEGEPGASMFVVVKGQLRAHRGEVTLGLLDESAVVGELAAILPGPRAASISATRFTHVLVLERALVHEIARTHPEVLRLLVQVVVRRLEGAAAAQQPPAARSA